MQRGGRRKSERMGTENGDGMGLKSQVQKEEKKIEQENEDEGKE